MNDLTTPWFWDTPDGGGWVRYWRGAFLCPYGREDRLREAYPEAMADYPGSRRPTAAERRAWNSIDPRVHEEGE